MINPFSLPFVSLINYKQLPEASGIYFVTSNDEILYIGISTNIRNRWVGHHRKSELNIYNDVKIHWYLLDDKKALPELEAKLIKTLKPKLNGSKVIVQLKKEIQDNTVKRGRGRPKGIGREGNYGTGVKTKLVRVPISIANDIPEILATFEQIKVFVGAWDTQIKDAALQSSTGQAPPRYDKAIEMLSELKLYLGD